VIGLAAYHKKFTLPLVMFILFFCGGDVQSLLIPTDYNNFILCLQRQCVVVCLVEHHKKFTLPLVMFAEAMCGGWSCSMS